MLASLLCIFSAIYTASAAPLVTPEPPYPAGTVNLQLPVHNVVRYPGIGFENLVIRSNGQILTTTASPNASIYQVDPLGILPLTKIYEINGTNVTGASGIAEGKPDIFYVLSGYDIITNPNPYAANSFTVTEIDVRGVHVLSNGTLNQQPVVKHIANLPHAGLLNGAAMVSHNSDHLLVADTFAGVIWNVNVCNGTVGVTLNDTTTQPVQNDAGINGIQVHNGTMYWTNTGSSTMYTAPIDKHGNVLAAPSLLTSDISCDDLGVDTDGTAYVAAPFDVIWKVSLSGEKEIVTGVYNSTSSSLVGPTSVRFGRRSSDRHSIYVSDNGGIAPVNLTSASGIYRIDLA